MDQLYDQAELVSLSNIAKVFPFLFPWERHWVRDKLRKKITCLQVPISDYEATQRKLVGGRVEIRPVDSWIGGVEFRISNHSRENWSYKGYARNQPIWLIKQKVDGGQCLRPGGWCGTGMSSFCLKPNCSVEVAVPVHADVEVQFGLHMTPETSDVALVVWSVLPDEEL